MYTVVVAVEFGVPTARDESPLPVHDDIGVSADARFSSSRRERAFPCRNELFRDPGENLDRW